MTEEPAAAGTHTSRVIRARPELLYSLVFENLPPGLRVEDSGAGMFFRVAAYMPKWCTVPDGTRVIREFEQCILDVLRPWAWSWRAR